MAKKWMSFFWTLLPAVVALVGGGYLLGVDQTKVILGWTLVVGGSIGLLGGLTNALSK